MNKSIVLITVNVAFEDFRENIGVFGGVEEKRYGLPLISEMLDQHGLKATWFLDVYNKNKIQYELDYRNACKDLEANGHELQLLTNPSNMYDPDRETLKDYSDQEQIYIIRKGKEIFTDWFGHEPLAHRAGGWGANINTLKALKSNHIFIDSSLYYGWPNCPLNEGPLTVNRPAEHDKILEIPATVFESKDSGFGKYRLFSTDGATVPELMEMMQKSQEMGISVINMVFNSYSFIRWNEGKTEYSIDNGRITRFKKLLEFLQNENSFEVMTLSQVHKIYLERKPEILLSSNDMPKSKLKHKARRFCDQIVFKVFKK